MPSISVIEHFDCSPEKAFVAVTDFPNAANYITGIIKVEMLTDGPMGVGTKVRETREMFGRKATEEMTITSWNSPNSAVIEAHSHGAHYISTYTVTPDGGGTKVELTFEARPQTLVAKLMAFLMSGMLKSIQKMLAKDLADAKRHAEAS